MGAIPLAAARTTGVSRVVLLGERYSMIVRFGVLFDPLVVEASLMENLRDAVVVGDRATGLLGTGPGPSSPIPD